MSLNELISLWGNRGANNIDEVLYHGYRHYEWQMTHAEGCVLIFLLSLIKPECSLEIGTAQGGSLSVLSKFSKQVFSLDIDPKCKELLGPQFPNVEFITGRSQETLPPLLKRLGKAQINIGFILIDGDHTTEGLKRDIEMVIKVKPRQPLFIIMHDSFNPDCRAGINQADWASSSYVHFVDLDFIPGVISDHPNFYHQMWGGFALALMLPFERKKELQISAGQEFLFQTVLPHSVHGAPSGTKEPMNIQNNLAANFQTSHEIPEYVKPLDYQVAEQLLNRVRGVSVVQNILGYPPAKKILKKILSKIQQVL